MANIIRGIGENLGRIVRYILPGLLVVAAAVAHPSWFDQLDISDSSHLIVLTVVAIVVGNTWYAFHRYCLHQVVDFLMYDFGSRGPAARRRLRGLLDYVPDLARHVVLSFRLDPAQPLRVHVALRASEMHLMYVASEAALLFSYWHESGSFFSRYSTAIRIAAVAFLPLILVQNIIIRRIDWLSTQGSRWVYPRIRLWRHTTHHTKKSRPT